MLRSIERIVQRVAREVDTQVLSSMARWTEADEVSTAWKAADGEGRTLPDTRVSLMAQWLSGKRSLPGVRPAATLPEVTRSALDQLLSHLRSQTRSVAAVWDELLTSRESLAFDPNLGLSAGQVDQVHQWCVRQTRIRAEAGREGEDPTLYPEAHTLLLPTWHALPAPLV